MNQGKPGFFGPRCQWVFEDGSTCEAPRVKGSIFCRHHGGKPAEEGPEEEGVFEPDLASSLAIVHKLKGQFSEKFKRLEAQGQLPDEEDLKRLAALLRLEKGLAEEWRKASGGPLTKLSDEVLPDFLRELFMPIDNKLRRADSYGDITPRQVAKSIWSSWTGTFTKFDINIPYFNEKPFGWPWPWVGGSEWPSEQKVEEFYNWWTKGLAKAIGAEVDPEVLERILTNFERLEEELLEGSPELGL